MSLNFGFVQGTKCELQNPKNTFDKISHRISCFFENLSNCQRDCWFMCFNLSKVTPEVENKSVKKQSSKNWSQLDRTLLSHIYHMLAKFSRLLNLCCCLVYFFGKTKAISRNKNRKNVVICQLQKLINNL